MTGTDSDGDNEGDGDSPTTGDAVAESARSGCATEDWPTFAITYTFNPGDLVGRDEPAPDELVLFQTDDRTGTTAWLTAERGSYVSVEDVR